MASSSSLLIGQDFKFEYIQPIPEFKFLSVYTGPNQEIVIKSVVDQNIFASTSDGTTFSKMDLENIDSGLFSFFNSGDAFVHDLQTSKVYKKQEEEVTELFATYELSNIRIAYVSNNVIFIHTEDETYYSTNCQELEVLYSGNTTINSFPTIKYFNNFYLLKVENNQTDLIIYNNDLSINKVIPLNFVASNITVHQDKIYIIDEENDRLYFALTSNDDFNYIEVEDIGRYITIYNDKPVMFNHQLNILQVVSNFELADIQVFDNFLNSSSYNDFGFRVALDSNNKFVIGDRFNLYRLDDLNPVQVHRFDLNVSFTSVSDINIKFDSIYVSSQDRIYTCSKEKGYKWNIIEVENKLGRINQIEIDDLGNILISDFGNQGSKVFKWQNDTKEIVELELGQSSAKIISEGDNIYSIGHACGDFGGPPSAMSNDGGENWSVINGSNCYSKKHHQIVGDNLFMYYKSFQNFTEPGVFEIPWMGYYNLDSNIDTRISPTDDIPFEYASFYVDTLGAIFVNPLLEENPSYVSYDNGQTFQELSIAPNGQIYPLSNSDGHIVVSNNEYTSTLSLRDSLLGEYNEITTSPETLPNIEYLQYFNDGTMLIADNTGQLLISKDLTAIENTEHINETKVNIFPNPATSHLTITSEKIIEFVNIYSVEGKLESSLHPNSYLHTIKLSTIRNGIILIEVIHKDRSRFYDKVLIKH